MLVDRIEKLLNANPDAPEDIFDIIFEMMDLEMELHQELAYAYISSHYFKDRPVKIAKLNICINNAKKV